VKIGKEGNQEKSDNIQNENSADNLKMNMDISMSREF